MLASFTASRRLQLPPYTLILLVLQLQGVDSEYKVDRLDDNLASKTIKAGDSVSGWAFFSKKNKPKNNSIPNKLRLKMLDQNGDTLQIHPINTAVGVSSVDTAPMTSMLKPSWVK